jgi:outer membrane lipoprotein-sorting protein
VRAGVINKRWDITGEPGQRQGGLTVGLLTPAWVNLVNVTPKGARTISGHKAIVFDTHFKGKKWASWFRLSMDPQKRYIVRLENFSGNGDLKYTVVFSEPVRVNGAWIPTRSKVFNAQGEQGAITKMDNIKVNAGLADSLFSLS